MCRTDCWSGLGSGSESLSLRAADGEPGRGVPDPRVVLAWGLTLAQRTYLQALVDNADLWETRIGNAQWAFHRVGLPYDRNACRKLML